jgi:hypothetical protein
MAVRKVFELMYPNTAGIDIGSATRAPRTSIGFVGCWCYITCG